MTHELRTPLTTFRLYTEMLDEGMVAERRLAADLPQDAPRRGRPARPPGRERPGLRPAGARPGGRRPRGRRARRACSTAWSLGSRFAPGRPGWSSSSSPVDSPAERAGGPLGRRSDPLEPGRQRGQVRRQRCRPPHPPGRRAGGRWLALTVRDHGPGLPPQVIRRLFRPFSKSAHDAAQSAPGVGLGLALSRRLARSLGRRSAAACENGPLGASFVLTIPFA